MSTSFYNLFQNFVISVSVRNYIYILKRLSTNIDFIQCLPTNKQSPQTTVLLLQYKELQCATPNFKILQTFFYFSLYSIFRYLIYHIQYFYIIIFLCPYTIISLYSYTIISLYSIYNTFTLSYINQSINTYIKTTPSVWMALFNKDLCSLVGGPGYNRPSQSQYKGHCVILDTRIYIQYIVYLQCVLEIN